MPPPGLRALPSALAKTPCTMRDLGRQPHKTLFRTARIFTTHRNHSLGQLLLSIATSPVSPAFASPGATLGKSAVSGSRLRTVATTSPNATALQIETSLTLTRVAPISVRRDSKAHDLQASILLHAPNYHPAGNNGFRLLHAATFFQDAVTRLSYAETPSFLGCHRGKISPPRPV